MIEVNLTKWSNAVEISSPDLAGVRVMVERGTGSIWVENDNPETVMDERDDWIMESMLKEADEISWREESW